MSNLTFIWDPKKETANRRKHGVSFEEARTVFLDENALLTHDPDHSTDEDRFVLLGMSLKPRILVVCHCYRAGEAIIRIISARKATRPEQKQYWDRCRT
ncbi:MAG: BrnT family toxin [Candidatus Aminicenantes bacterium]|nr:BrnT family toxin [Candidatus Aminicenantes bacterium]